MLTSSEFRLSLCMVRKAVASELIVLAFEAFFGPFGFHGLNEGGGNDLIVGVLRSQPARELRSLSLWALVGVLQLKTISDNSRKIILLSCIINSLDSDLESSF